jgi:hypothetical protein
VLPHAIGALDDVVRGAVALVLALGTAGCAGATVAPDSPVPPAEPGVSWRIRSGSYGESGEAVCSSDTPGPCVLRASAPGDPRGIALSVFLHPAATATTFAGAIRLGPIDASERYGMGHELNLDGYQVKPGERPPGVSAAGRLTDQPGTYTITIALLASTPGRVDPRQLSIVVPVRVEPPAALAS